MVGLGLLCYKTLDVEGIVMRFLLSGVVFGTCIVPFDRPCFQCIGMSQHFVGFVLEAVVK